MFFFRIIILIVLIFLLFSHSLHGAYLERKIWQKDETFSEFLEKYKIPLSLYYNLDKEDKEIVEEIYSGITFYILKNSNNPNILEQALIPISEELQIHVYLENKKYFFETIPLIHKQYNQAMVLKFIEHSIYNNIRHVTNSTSVASLFIRVFKNRIDFKSLYKDSIIGMLYSRYYNSLGEPFGSIKLKVAMLESGKKKKYVFNYNSKYYNYKGQHVERTYFIVPVKNPRITSKFTRKRWHPILKRYRAHLGVDYGAKRGTPIYSAGNGIVSYKGKSRGYGNMLKIKHKEGYQTLYAHMSKFRKWIKKGDRVKKGEIIGYVGSTGLSTGPHLHFGLYRNGIALNPEKIVKIENYKSIPKKKKKYFYKIRNKYILELNSVIKNFRNGLNVTNIYQPIKLKCEASISIKIKNHDKVEKKSKIKYNKETLELSEEYLEY